MRLIDTRNIELRWFNDNDIPKYAILSHTWGPDEINYQDFIWICKARALSSELSSSSTSSLPNQDARAALMLAMEMMIRGHAGTSPANVSNEDLMERVGYSKIIHAAEQALSLGCDYLWVDTCCTIQTHHRRQRPTKRVAYAAENGGRTYIAFQYTPINISVPFT